MTNDAKYQWCMNAFRDNHRQLHTWLPEKTILECDCSFFASHTYLVKSHQYAPFIKNNRIPWMTIAVAALSCSSDQSGRPSIFRHVTYERRGSRGYIELQCLVFFFQMQLVELYFTLLIISLCANGKHFGSCAKETKSTGNRWEEHSCNCFYLLQWIFFPFNMKIQKLVLRIKRLNTQKRRSNDQKETEVDQIKSFGHWKPSSQSRIR